jgi:general secretion pathway protein E
MDVIPETARVFQPVGCENCEFTGYKGRVGIYELISVDNTLRTMIHDHRSEYEMLDYVRKQTPSLMDSGLGRVMDGTTSLDEVVRVTRTE